MTATVQCVETGRWRENCYVVVGHGGEGLIIDPGADAHLIQAHIDATGISVSAVLLTHGHFDHVGAVALLCRQYGATGFLHAGDHSLLRRANFYRTLFDSDAPIEIPKVEALPKDRKHLHVAGLTIDILETPGHTPGSVCFRIGDVLFSGDTLHRGRAGRTDLPGGNSAVLEDSLKRLSRLPSQILVHPGHGGLTTIGAEVQSGALRSSLEEL